MHEPPLGGSSPRRATSEHVSAGLIRRRRLRALVGALVLVVLLAIGWERASGSDDADPGASEAQWEDPASSGLTSQNGWPAITSGTDERLAAFPWVTGRVLDGDVHTVLSHVAEQFDAEVEPIDVDSSWGWADRSVRGSDDLSNHASGTAIDLNATRHPLGASGTFTEAQIAAIRAILEEVEPVVHWGGDYVGRKDEMHFEVVGSADDVADVAARLRSARGG